MAEQAGLARTRFAHLCRKLTNRSPSDSLQHLRVEQAKRLPVQDRHPITEIAFDCGFAPSAYFTAGFRRHTHCPPRELRDLEGKATGRA